MALLWIEGFEGFGDTLNVTPSPTGILGRKYPIINRESSMRIVSGRNGYALKIIGSLDYAQTSNLTTDRWLTMGCAIKILDSPVTETQFIAFYDGGNRGIYLKMNSDGTINIYGSTLIGTTTNALSLNTWYYIELQVYTDSGVSGSIELRVNDAVWYQNLACDTQAGPNNYHTAFRIGVSDESTLYDDIYLLDGSGLINNDFLGIRKVSAIRPDAAGDDTDWTPDSGNNYDRVNEVELDGDFSFVETGTTTDKDLYNYDPTVNITSIDGIQIMTEAKATSGSMELQNLTKSESTEDAQSCGTIISTDYVTCVSVGEVNPDTSLPWTPPRLIQHSLVSRQSSGRHYHGNPCFKTTY